MVYDTQITIVFMGFINHRSITGGPHIVGSSIMHHPAIGGTPITPIPGHPHVTKSMGMYSTWLQRVELRSYHVLGHILGIYSLKHRPEK